MGEALYYVHVGDTRFYLIRDGRITQVTRDHSYVGRLVEAGMISRAGSGTHPQRNILTAALGTAPELFMDAPGSPEKLRRDDVMVICSRWIVGTSAGRGNSDAVKKHDGGETRGAI